MLFKFKSVMNVTCIMNAINLCFFPQTVIAAKKKKKMLDETA